jgi:hypothetical protein
MAFHSSLHVFKRLWALAGATEHATAAQTAAAQRAASPDFMDDISFVDRLMEPMAAPLISRSHALRKHWLRGLKAYRT